MVFSRACWCYWIANSGIGRLNKVYCPVCVVLFIISVHDISDVYKCTDVHIACIYILCVSICIRVERFLRLCYSLLFMWRYRISDLSFAKHVEYLHESIVGIYFEILIIPENEFNFRQSHSLKMKCHSEIWIRIHQKKILLHKWRKRSTLLCMFVTVLFC